MIVSGDFYSSTARPQTRKRERPVAFLGCVRVPNEDGSRMGLLPRSYLRELFCSRNGSVLPVVRDETMADPGFSVEALKGGRPVRFWDRDIAFEAARQLRVSEARLDPHGSMTLTPREDRVMVTWRRDGILYHGETVHHAPRMTLLRLTDRKTYEFIGCGFSILLRVFPTKEEADNWVSTRARLSHD